MHWCQMKRELNLLIVHSLSLLITRSSCALTSIKSIHSLFLISHLLVELVQELVKLWLLLSRISLCVFHLFICIDTDAKAEENLEDKDDSNGDGHAIHWNCGWDCVGTFESCCCGCWWCGCVCWWCRCVSRWSRCVCWWCGGCVCTGHSLCKCEE